MHILVVNGPNMNMLGIRQPEIYGHETYEDLKALIRAEADRLGASVSFFQSNHEGALVDAIQQAYFDHVDGIIINPAAYTHTSVALLDAVKKNPANAAAEMERVFEEENRMQDAGWVGFRDMKNRKEKQ